MKKKMKGRWKGKEKLLLGIWGGIVGIGGDHFPRPRTPFSISHPAQITIRAAGLVAQRYGIGAIWAKVTRWESLILQIKLKQISVKRRNVSVFASRSETAVVRSDMLMLL